MKMEKEITVLVTCSYAELHKQLVDKDFIIKEDYELNDDYMINNDIDIKSLEKLNVLKQCILVRDIVGIKKVLLYKYKKYDEVGNILEQGKVECPIEDISKAVSFMESINYKKLFKIYDKCIVYYNNTTELVVQLVNDKYIFIELESEDNSKSIEELKEELNNYKLSYDKNNYFVKKAKIMLDNVLKGE